MTDLDGWSLDAGPTEGETDLRATAARLLDDLGGPAAGGTVVSVRGAGGTGKSALLAELGALWSAAGLPVLGLRRAPVEPSSAGPARRDIAVLLDDAHRLDGPQLAKARRLAGEPGVRLALAYRPWPRPPALAELVRTGHTGAAVLGHLTRPALHRWVARELGAAVLPSLVDAVLQQTGGLPALALPLLRRLPRTAPGPAVGRMTPAQPPRLEIPSEVTERIRDDLAAMDDRERVVLSALAVGAPVDTDLLGDALGMPSRQATDLVGRARASGFLLPSGEVIPLVRRVLLSGAPRETVRGLRRRLLDRGEQPVDPARALAVDDGAEPPVTGVPPHGGAAVKGRSRTPRGSQLSSREREVAELLVTGQTYRQVGGRLFISAKTVEHHVARIRQRLGASNRSDLLARLRAELAQGA